MPAQYNKFCLIPGHLLVVPRAFMPQEAGPSAALLALSLRAATQYGALAFYNAGRHSGFSQPHMHMQVVPLPLDGGVDGGEGAPVDAAFAAPRVEGQRLQLAPFARLGVSHAACLLKAEHGEGDGAQLEHTLRRLLAEVGAPESYNVCMTARWMLVVPRSAEEVEGRPFALNALTWAGTVLCKDSDDVTDAEGLARILQAISVPVDAGNT